MATFELDPKYEPLADEILLVFSERDIVLSEYATGLLRFSVEAWSEDTPMSRFSTEIDYQAMAKRIAELAIRDSHIDRRKSARFTDVLVALSDAGKRVLRDALEKGF